MYMVVPGQAPVRISGTEAGGTWQSGACPSPDGTRLAYTAGTGLYVVPSDGSTAAIKVSGAALEWREFRGLPFWSVDGTRLAFVAALGPEDPARLWVTLADGSADPVDVSGSAVGEGTCVLEASVGWSRLSN
jgi:Tol biopolymer transport system component